MTYYATCVECYTQYEGATQVLANRAAVNCPCYKEEGK